MSWEAFLDEFRRLPVWAQALSIVGLVAGVVVLAYAVIQLLAAPFSRRNRPGDESLTDQLRSLLRARAEGDNLDARFDRLVQGTLLGVTPEFAAGLVLFLAAAAGLATYLTTFDEIYTGAAALGAGGLTWLVFWFLRNRRRRAIQEQLPDGCFQLARSLRAGLNLPLALRETTTYTPAPLSRLFDRLTVALNLGESTRTSVARVADEARVTDFDLFAEVLVLNSESGGNLPSMLDRLAASIRDRNQYRGYFRSVTALSRATAFFLILAAPVGLLLYRILQPELFWKFVNDSMGQNMLLGALGLEILGIIWIAYLLRRQDDY